jgi:integrase
VVRNKWCSGHFRKRFVGILPTEIHSFKITIEFMVGIFDVENDPFIEQESRYIKVYEIENVFEKEKSGIFSKEEIEKFLVEAPNQIYLMMKVVTIMGVAGACRGDELHKMKLKDVERDKENVAVVNIKESKNNMLRRFVVSNSADSQVDYLKLLRDYIKLRPRNAQDERLFYRYERGRCVNQVVGKHTIAKVGTHDE